MRFKTIWTIPNMALAERLRRTLEWWCQIVARALPRRIRYWVTMIEISKATKNNKNIPATPLDEILQNLDHPDTKR